MARPGGEDADRRVALAGERGQRHGQVLRRPRGRDHDVDQMRMHGSSVRLPAQRAVTSHGSPPCTGLSGTQELPIPSYLAPPEIQPEVAAGPPRTPQLRDRAGDVGLRCWSGQRAELERCRPLSRRPVPRRTSQRDASVLEWHDHGAALVTRRHCRAPATLRLHNRPVETMAHRRRRPVRRSRLRCGARSRSNGPLPVMPM